MINYFKYITTGSFTYNSGIPYSGMVHVLGSNVYSGSILTSNSRLLSSTNTFFPQVILNKLDIGPSYNTQIPVKRANILQRDILNLNTVKSIIDTLNVNNLRIYSNQITYNPDIFNSLTKTSDELTFTQCITSANDNFSGKKIPTARINADQTDFYKVRSTTSDNNSLFVSLSGGTYYYFNNSSMMVSDNSANPPIINSGLEAINFDHKYIQYNPYTSTLYYTDLNACYVYNFTFTKNNATLSLSDKFDISAIRSLDDRRNSVYGANYRSALVKEQGVSVLEISYNLSQVLLNTFSASDLGFDTLNRIVQRFEDDILVIVGYIDNTLHCKVFDISELLTNTKPIYSNVLQGCDENDVYELASFDSNILIVRRFNEDKTLNSIELRKIDNSTLPLLRLTTDSLLGFIRVNQVIDQQHQNIDKSDIVLLPKSAKSNNNIIFDIQFSVSDTLNALIVFSDSFCIVNNVPFLNLVPLDLIKRYQDVDISDNSIGFNINNAIKNLISDTVSLYLNSTKKYKFSSGAPIGVYPNTVGNIQTDNLYLYENEYLNVGVLNRMFNTLFFLQQKLAININSPV